ncbi:hypothetical protein ACPVTF_07005 [Geobacillus icigianus]|uniref:Uncharacterized protein n=1 Tax=Geobacillus subterraneus TaxID=129338 RepID=A0A679FL54_9BACL|nr:MULTISPECIES: hypothetical protein [Geobacillus]KYD23772.1 hypothetical protein B4113_3137 [Geobacillus sp. B4113_201601]BBW96663.1 hypothetical protein GsuE55_14960 [Geobacillus subterraneus]
MDVQLPALQSVMPKAPEAGNMQTAAAQHPYTVQAQLAAAAEKQREQARRRVTDKRTNDRARWEASRFGSHPYKGKTIDLKG